MGSFYKGFVKTKNKQCVQKYKNARLLTLEEAQQLDEYAGILAPDAVLIDIDEYGQSETLLNIIDHLQIKCKVYETTRGKHFLFKNKDKTITKCYTHTKLAIGLTADIKVGLKNSYEVLKFNGKGRKVLYDKLAGEEYDEVPKFLIPVKTNVNLLGMREGDGRNNAVFSYIPLLQSAGLTKEEIKGCVDIINKYVFADPLEEREIETLTRDDVFQKDIFYKDKRFLFDSFATYLLNNANIRLINNTLHIYRNGVYVDGSKYIEQEMIKNIPNLRNADRVEVLKYLNLIAPEIETCNAYNIAFKNGIYNLSNDQLSEFNPNIVITNLIDHVYNKDAYSALGDKTLNKLACGDKKIRALLEEVIGYCFFRRNELRKSFILLGDKKNGKSTFLDIIANILGEDNISTLDLKEIGDRFRTAELFGKLANIGDDIDDEYIASTAVFKKVVSGDPITVERKGQDPFKLKSYSKFLFSANSIPRMKDKTGAVLDRLIVVPFNATFSKEDPDFDPYIKSKLKEEDVLEYFIKVGVDGLKRVLENNAFTTNEDIKEEMEEFNEKNNPVILFFKEVTEDDILYKGVKEVYLRYRTWCDENGYQAMSTIEFGKTVKNQFDVEAQPRKINGASVRVYIKKTTD